MIDAKNVQGKKNLFGQFFTPDELSKNIIDGIENEDAIYIEPSYGEGSFLKLMEQKYDDVLGIELDDELFEKYNTPNTICKNFYDFELKTDKKIIFIGNPPYRTPAYSLSTHKEYIHSLRKKYGISGVREECVFFILKTLDIIYTNNVQGDIHYILPNSIIKNNSKFYNKFKEFILSKCKVVKIQEINGSEFEGVAQDLMYIHFNTYETPTTETLVNGVFTNLRDYFCMENKEEFIYNEIFKKTYLGSVPCESLLMSVHGEPLEHFKNRLVSIISDEDITVEKLYERLSYNGKFHLKVFSKPFESDAVQKKLQIILSYVKVIQGRNILHRIKDESYYKPITNRGDKTDWYYRDDSLKNVKEFVYQINPNPCKSFYFSGNPSSNSGDYFGFCDYDVNRNISPGAARCVPVDDLEDNLTDEFKEWWKSNTDEPYDKVFDYIIKVSKSDWYKEKKKNNKRFYFSIPKRWLV